MALGELFHAVRNFLLGQPARDCRQHEGWEVPMAFMVGDFVVEDYATWKELFDSDPVGRKETAKGHVLLRSLDDPNEVFVRVEFDSAEEAKAFREKLLGSGALASANVKTLAVTEMADEATY